MRTRGKAGHGAAGDTGQMLAEIRTALGEIRDAVTALLAAADRPRPRKSSRGRKPR